MIATKTTALMLALGMLGIAGMMFASPSVYAQSNTAVANNEDNDVVVQSNEAKIEQEAENNVKCEAENESENIALNIAANDCDENTQTNAQTASVTQTNANSDDDVQTAVADAEQSVCGQLALLGLQVCGNEVE
jgi:hypothetical protein